MGNKIKVYYDFQILFSQRFGGISRYFYELVSGMKNYEEFDAYIQCIKNQNFYFESYFGKEVKKVIKNAKVKKAFRILNRVYTLLQLRKRYDIVHPTYYDTYFLGHHKGKLVVTVYDMTQEVYKEQFPDSVREDKRRMIYESDHIIAISESTKNDILRIYPDIPEEKITVIYLATNLEPNEGFECTIPLPERYILFVGHRGDYKNFNTFFEGIRNALAEDETLHLVCAGGNAFSDDEKGMIGDLMPKVVQVNCTNEELAYLYQHAICFVFPSLYEGFGLPTLEAFACGCPSIISSASCMHEVGGEAAEYFDPSSAQDIGRAVKRVLYDNALRDSMIEKGREQLAKFSWELTAENTARCYKKVLGIESI